MTEEEKKAIDFLSEKLGVLAVKTASKYSLGISEIRLREGRKVSLTIGGKNVVCDAICQKKDISEIISKICKGSMYSYSDSIRNGVIFTEYGIRVGVAGHAVTNSGKIECVRDICSVNIRIPHRIKGAADIANELVRKHGSVLIYSLPGEGKTTVLRELIPILSSGENAARVSVIDSRYELTAGVDDGDLADVFFGYPREDAIVQSVRTMSPEYIICDEISSASDADAIMYAHAAGVRVIATAHASDLDGLLKNRNIAVLIENGVFGCFWRIGDDIG